ATLCTAARLLQVRLHDDRPEVRVVLEIAHAVGDEVDLAYVDERDERGAADDVVVEGCPEPGRGAWACRSQRARSTDGGIDALAAIGAAVVYARARDPWAEEAVGRRVQPAPRDDGDGAEDAGRGGSWVRVGA